MPVLFVSGSLCLLPDAGCVRGFATSLWAIFKASHMQDAGCSLRFPPAWWRRRTSSCCFSNKTLLSDHHWFHRGSFCPKMLTDMILEEEFEKNKESWYNPQELEHGKRRSPGCGVDAPWNFVWPQVWGMMRHSCHYWSYYYFKMCFNSANSALK